MKARLLKLGVVCLAMGTASGPVLASHHLLEQALQNARCAPRLATQTYKQGSLTAYDVICLGRSPDRLLVVCNGRTCIPDNPNYHSSDDED